jgi:hypothetical protein
MNTIKSVSFAALISIGSISYSLVNNSESVQQTEAQYCTFIGGKVFDWMAGRYCVLSNYRVDLSESNFLKSASIREQKFFQVDEVEACFEPFSEGGVQAGYIDLNLNDLSEVRKCLGARVYTLAQKYPVESQICINLPVDAERPGNRAFLYETDAFLGIAFKKSLPACFYQIYEVSDLDPSHIQLKRCTRNLGFEWGSGFGVFVKDIVKFQHCLSQ